jgi:hypothetical protein
MFPGLSLKRRLKRGAGDAAGVVRYRRGSDDGNDLERVILAVTGREESIDVLVIEKPALFDHGLCQGRQRSELGILRQPALTERAQFQSALRRGDRTYADPGH